MPERYIFPDETPETDEIYERATGNRIPSYQTKERFKIILPTFCFKYLHLFDKEF